MKTVGIVMIGCALLLGAFAWWGIYTDSGRRRFDEMAGMIPFFAGILAGIVFIAGGVLFFLGRR